MSKVMSELLVASAEAVGDTLTLNGVDSSRFAFSLVIWPKGEPERCSSVCGCGDPSAETENPTALAAASEKAKRGNPIILRKHQSPKPN